MEKEFYIYKKNCNTGQVKSYTYASSKKDAEELVQTLNSTAPFPYMYFFLPDD